MAFQHTTAFVILLAVLLVAAHGKHLRKTIYTKAAENLILKIEDGSIRGRQSQTVRDNMTYYAFEGIPFAQPPVGNLRFQPPIPNDKWNGTLDATAWRNICIQDNAEFNTSEDCLYINVYTPTLTKKNLPVMVWIYGGSFIGGSGNIVPDYILEQKDVILVSFNYRLGLFGFISTGDLVLPGNAGLKDQVLALKWVQRNIAHFGGNPQSVTIFGESAGGASVAYLMQSKLAKGLFKHGIMQSGSSLCLWSLSRTASKIAFGIGENLGVSTPNSTELLNALLKVNASALLNAGEFASLLIEVTTNPLQGLPIGPVKEPEHEGALFTGLSHQTLSSGNYQQVPTIVGYNSLEADFDFSWTRILKNYVLRVDVMDSDLVPIDMNISNPYVKSDVGNQIKEHYFGNSSVASQTANLLQFLSDDQINRASAELARLLSKNAPVYFYVFSYKGPLGTTSNRSDTGVGHTEELPYLLYPPNNKPSPYDIVVSRRLCRLWTNFAKYGNPTPQKDSLLSNTLWRPTNSLNATDLVYLDIGSKLNLSVNPNKVNVDFYQKLYNEYGKPPYDTY